MLWTSSDTYIYVFLSLFKRITVTNCFWMFLSDKRLVYIELFKKSFIQMSSSYYKDLSMLVIAIYCGNWFSFINFWFFIGISCSFMVARMVIIFSHFMEISINEKSFFAKYCQIRTLRFIILQSSSFIKDSTKSAKELFYSNYKIILLDVCVRLFEVIDCIDIMVLLEWSFNIIVSS